MSGTPMATRVRYQALGVVFLLIFALFVAVTIASYRKFFTHSVTVNLETDHLGNQLRTGADVKVRGMVVGQVSSIRADGEHAVLGLALEPDKTKAIPANVSARLLPKTLFGERYVALQIPSTPDARRLSDGDVITQDRSSAAIELERVLADLLPVLQAVRPEKLATTLNALSQALEGRGEQFGSTLVRLNGYLDQLAPSLPDLKADIAALASVSQTLGDAAPDLLQSMSDLTTTSRTLVAMRTELGNLFATLTNASVDLTNFLQVNRNNLINLVATAKPTLQVLAKYAPEYPCMLKQIADRVPAAEAAFGKGQQHPNMMRVTLEITGDRGKYLPGVDTPRYDDKRGPRCYEQVDQPGVFPQYPPDGAIKDGSTKPPPPRRQNGSTQIIPGSTGGTATSTGNGGATSPQSAADGGQSAPTVANSAGEQRLVGLLAAAELGVLPENVPDWARFLVAPVYRGTEVTVE